MKAKKFFSASDRNSVGKLQSVFLLLAGLGRRKFAQGGQSFPYIIVAGDIHVGLSG